jgi:hypothetical protein
MHTLLVSTHMHMHIHRRMQHLQHKLDVGPLDVRGRTDGGVLAGAGISFGLHQQQDRHHVTLLILHMQQ